MSLIQSKCVQFEDDRKICVAEENGKKFELKNNSGLIIKKIKVNFWLAQEVNEKRCDFLMSIDRINKPVVFFIELKGGDLVEAVKQLLDSVIFLKEEFRNYVINARIIGSRDVPGFVNTPAYKKLGALVEQFNGSIKRSTNKIMSELI